jgi:carbon-monoxide dehydrogenase small subunit
VSTHRIRATINGDDVECDVEARTLLVDFLRDQLGLVGTRVSCGIQVCGACTVLVDGLPLSSCMYLAVDVDGRQVTTIEGISPDAASLSPVQQAFVDAGAIQCGYCTPGFVLGVTALLEANPDPSDAEIKHFLDGNLCRCTGYQPVLEAVHLASLLRQERQA